jgi:SAM-dependent methyltransferase
MVSEETLQPIFASKIIVFSLKVMIHGVAESQNEMNVDLSGSYAMTGLPNEGQIRTKAQPTCILCGYEGRPIYSGQKDRLFGAGGLWDLKICPNRECGLIWLDPMPLPGDIGKAYANYYTHLKRDEMERVGFLRRIYQLMKRGYWASKYNYQIGPAAFSLKILGKFLYFFPLRRSEVEADVRHLEAVPQGRLLDVGCGSGEWLATMRKLGWEVEGIDFDENAIRVARQSGLQIHHGSLEQQGFSNENFDAVVLNHVIEHVPDPIGTLVECARILKPGGKLVLFTPNSSSLSHQLFKRNWRGLEPPRHLHIFSMQSMAFLLARAGFKNSSIQPQIAKSVIYESVLLRRGQKGPFSAQRRNWSVDLFARLFNMIELCLMKWKPSLADCLVVTATK